MGNIVNVQENEKGDLESINRLSAHSKMKLNLGGVQRKYTWLHVLIAGLMFGVLVQNFSSKLRDQNICHAED